MTGAAPSAEERRELWAGAAVLALALAGAVFVVAIAPRLALADSIRVHVYFTELAGLREGAPVRSAGMEIGRVESISLAPEGAIARLGGRAGAAVEVALARAELARTWKRGSVVIGSRGLLSARFLELLPPDGELGPPLADGDELRGVDPPTLDRVLQRTWNNLRVTRRFAQEVAPEARRVRAELANLRATLHELLARPANGSGGASARSLDDELAQALAEAELALGDALGGRAGWDRAAAVLARALALRDEVATSWAGLSRDAAALAVALDAALAQVRRRAPAERVTEVVATLERTVGKLAVLGASAEAIWQRWQRREGTLGRLLSDPEFPEDAKELGKILKRQPWRIFGRPPDEIERAR